MTSDAAQSVYSWDTGSVPDQHGRVAVVTGASSGLGAVIARELALRGATVVLAVRDTAKGERVRDGFGPDAASRCEVRALALDDLDSVRRFAAGTLEAHPRLDLLVNNAGSGRPVLPLTRQGFQRTFATNHLGHFALTGLLLPGLARGERARVVSVGSNLYRRVRVEMPLDDLAAPAPAGEAYVASKLAVLMFALELDRRLRFAGSTVRSFAAHPGVADTPMQRQAGNPLEWVVGRALNAAIGRSPEAGALPILFAATAPQAPGAVLLGPSLRKNDLRVHAEPPRPPADDVELAARLWTVSEAATGVSFDLEAAPGPAMALRAVARRPGGPDVLHVEPIASPAPGPGQVRIAVQGAGVAFGDAQARQGRYPLRFPITPGYDVVGHVDALGPGVITPEVGQRVAAYTGTGGYTTSALARAELSVPVAEDLDTALLSALVLNYTTAWQMLHRVAQVPVGGTVLVLGAAGGVGSALTELAVRDGLRVYGTASAARRAALTARNVTVLDDPTDVPEPVDATFDPVGGPSLAASRRLTRRDGTLVSYGIMSASTRNLSRTRGLASVLTALARARATPGARVVSFSIAASVKKDPAAFAADLTQLVGLLAADTLHPQVTPMPLRDAAEAHRRLEARQVLGKLVLLT